MTNDFDFIKWAAGIFMSLSGMLHLVHFRKTAASDNRFRDIEMHIYKSATREDVEKIYAKMDEIDRRGEARAKEMVADLKISMEKIEDTINKKADK